MRQRKGGDRRRGPAQGAIRHADMRARRRPGACMQSGCAAAIKLGGGVAAAVLAWVPGDYPGEYRVSTVYPLGTR